MHVEVLFPLPFLPFPLPVLILLLLGLRSMLSILLCNICNEIRNLESGQNIPIWV